MKCWIFEVIAVAKLHQKAGWRYHILQIDSSTPQHPDVPKIEVKGFYYLSAFVEHLPKM